jgi:4-amino-4-deoxy-L-arabinose transferase-like glycosyltransferase
MTRRTRRVLIAAAVLLVAAGLRFWHLGAWPLWRDEIETFREVESFTGQTAFPVESQTYRLPRLTPLSFELLAWGQRVFGADEFGSRVVPAIMGVAQIALVLLLLRGSLGRRTAFAVALLMVFWPDHINRSQENRFYSIAATLATLTMLLGAHAVRRRSVVWMVAACCIACAAVLAHTLLALLLGGLFAAMLAASWPGQDQRLRRLAWIAPAAGVLVAVAFTIWLLPLARGWNEGATFGSTPARSLLAATSLLGWPVALLAGLGICLMARNPTPTDAYWLAWTACLGLGVVTLPLVVVYHSEYTFLFAFAAVVPAGRAVARVAELLRGRSPALGTAWLGIACLLNLPSLLSHYVDGSRHDFRAPAQFVASQWHPGDRVSTFSPHVFQHYAPEIQDVVSLPDDPTRLGALAGRGRLWIVVWSQRGGKPAELETWLARHCRLCFAHRPHRFDYYDHNTEVYLLNPEDRQFAVGRAAAAQWGPPEEGVER